MERNVPLALVAAALASTLVPLGCIYPAERGKMLEDRVDRLESDRKDLEQEVKKQRRSLDDQVAQVQAALEKLEKTAHRTGADIAVQVDQMQADLARLRGAVDQSQHRIEEMQAALDKLKAAPPAVPAAGTPGPAPAPATASGGADAPDGGVQKADGPAAARPPEKPTDRQGLAQMAERMLAQDPPAGRKLAEEWFRKYPKATSASDQKAWSALAARMHYQLGSALMAQKDWRGALSEFGEIVKSFARSDEAPDALLKSADCFAALKMTEESRLALEEIVNAYPKSEAAKQAKAKLADLKKKPAAKKR